MKKRAGNTIKMVILTALLGGFAGLLIWCFLKAVSVCTYYLWDILPQSSGITYLPVAVCVAGGLVTGLLHRFFGDYPEELNSVMGKIKKDKHYDYHHITVMLICAFIPLVCGASVGPEAGLTGFIAALCYWVGDNVTFARKNTDIFSEIGEAVTLGQLFHSPLFGIIAVEEGEGQEILQAQMSRGNKLLFYGISTASGVLTGGIMTHFLGAALEGFPSFSEVTAESLDYIMLLVYIPLGLILYALFELSEKLTAGLGRRIPVVLRETLCGAVTGIMTLTLPMVMFSGEEQMGELMETFISFSPLFLIGISILKIIMTTFCINLGLKGGHFFPLIFACVCMGFALSIILFPRDSGSHAAFAAAAVTGTVLGAQLKKPFTASLLLLLCFPVNVLIWVFLCAVTGKAAITALPIRYSRE